MARGVSLLVLALLTGAWTSPARAEGLLPGPLEGHWSWRGATATFETADRAHVTNRVTGRWRMPSRPGLLVFCDASYRAARSEPFRIACRAETQTSSVPAYAVAVSAGPDGHYRGYALTRTSTLNVSRGPDRCWRLATSTSASTLAEVRPPSRRSTTYAAHWAPDLSAEERQALSAILYGLVSVPDLWGQGPYGTVIPGLIRSSTAAAAGFDVWASARQRFRRLGRPALAEAILELGAPPPEEDPVLRDELLAAAYDDPARGGLTFALGLRLGTPVGVAAEALPRASSGGLLMSFGVDLGRRFEAYGVIDFGSSTLARDVLARRLLGGGKVALLTHFERDGSSSSGDVDSLGMGFGLRWAPVAWALRPFLVLQAGWRYEPFKYTGPDVPATCGDFNCPHRAGFRILAPATGWSLAPGLGLRHPILHGRSLGLELRFEVLGHFTFWSVPLIYEGEVTPTGLEVYQRLRALEPGSPTFALSAGIWLEARAAVF